MSDADNNRVCNTDTLLDLALDAKRFGLNRQIDYRLAERELDADGTHLLKLVLWGHNGSMGEPLHHRVYVFAKCIGTHEPQFFTLDIRDVLWRQLSTVDAYMASASAADGEATKV
jgi:hypothetical protein